MAGNIDIVNRALTKLGQPPITALTDEVQAAILASSLFEAVRDAELAIHRWNFAVDRQALPADMDKPAFGWAHQYTLPADCLRVLEIVPWPQPVMADYVSGDTADYTLEGRKLLTNRKPPIRLIYLRHVRDAGIYPPEFVDALACRLAAEMAESLTGSNSKREMAWKEYDQAVRAARRANAIAKPPQKIQDDTWMTAHLMGVM